MKKLRISLLIAVILLIVSIIGICIENNDVKQIKRYGFYFEPGVNINPVGRELNLLLNSIRSINTVFEDTNGNILVMFKDGRLVHIPNKDENSFSKLSSVNREEGYWTMDPSYMTELTINKIILSDGANEKADISITTRFHVENPEETGFEVIDKSKIKFIERNFHLKKSFTVNDTDERILSFLNE